MTDLATLGLAVSSQPVEQGARALDKLTAAAKVAERAATGFSTSMRGAAAAAAGATVASNAEAGALDRVTTSMNMNSAAVRANSAALQINANTAKYAALQQRMLVFQLNDVFVSLASGMNPLMVAIQQGSQISQIYGPGEGGMGRAFRESGKMLLGVVTKFPLLSAAAAGATAAVAGMRHEINEANNAAVSFGDVALGALQALGDVIYGLLKPAIDAIAPWFASAWEVVKNATKTVGNLIINSFRAAFEDVKFLWNTLPDIIGAAMIGVVNLVLEGINSMLQAAADGIDVLIEQINKIPTLNVPMIGAVEGFGPIDNPFADRVSNAVDDRNRRVDEIMNDDPLGRYYGMTEAHALSNFADRTKDDKRGKSEADRVREQMERRLEAMRQGLLTEEEAERNSFASRMTEMKDFYDAGLISQQEYNEMAVAAARQHNDRLTELDRQSAQKRLAIFSGYADSFASMFESLGDIIGTEGKKQFEISKGLSIATAIIKGAEAAVSSYAKGAEIGGPPLGAVFAAAAVAATGAQIAAISRQQYNGGGGSTSVGGGAPAAAVPTPQAAAPVPQQAIYVNLQGQTFGREQVRELIEQINEASRDGAKLLVSAA